jgi:predicted AAA+ superfamily ATPase
MEYLERSIQKTIRRYLKPGKAIIITGARRTGKTVLLRRFAEDQPDECLFLNGEDFSVQEQFTRRTESNYRSLLGKKRLLIIDEATAIPEIGKAVKLMLDTIPDLKVMLSGSSSFDLSNKTGEPLTGRKYTFNLYPFSDQELTQNLSSIEIQDTVRERLIYGSYPEVNALTGKDEKVAYLREVANSYLLKDILAFENLRNSSKLRDLLRLLAYQVSNEVSLNELSGNLQITRATVERYIDLLMKVWIVFKVEPFSRNLRKEISKSARYYFFDNGIRNILINNLEPLDIRNDTGQLWENFAISERIKAQEASEKLVSNHFWRTYDQQEIDWIEDREGKLFAYEMKWNPDRKNKCPDIFSRTYPGSSFMIVSRNNYQEFLKH